MGRRFAVPVLIAAACLAAAALAVPGSARDSGGTGPPGTAPRSCEEPQVPFRASRAIGEPSEGRLVRGVRLPVAGDHHFTWDHPLARLPNRPWRRWGLYAVVDRVLRVICRFAEANPDAPRIAVGDISRPRGGDFGPRFGGLGHASHQNGVDVDVYYPRRNGAERIATRPGQVDLNLAQRLVSRFVRAGAVYVFVGERLQLRGPKRVVVPWPHHDDHLHVRFRKLPSIRPAPAE